MRFRILGIVLMVAAAAAVFASCSLSKSGVELRSKEQLQEIAERDHGSVTFLREEKESGRNTCYFLDDTFGFEFSISSFANGQGMDGSTFYYDESILDNWFSGYGDHLTEKVVAPMNSRLDDQLRVLIKTSNHSISGELHFYGEYAELEPQIKETCAELAAADTANALSDEIPIYMGDGELYKINCYHISDGILDDPDEVRAGSMFDYVEVVTGKEIERGAIEKPASPDDVPGLSEVGYSSPSKGYFFYPNTELRLYRFKMDGRDYFITNVIRADDGNYYIAEADGTPFDYD